jgi:Rrf2 family transcriptional regulator, iron-sulfur cluster assembly transcription factor
LTRAGEYAVRCVLFMSACSPGRIVKRKQIADAMEIPEQFLSKIAQQLSHRGIIEIIQGPKGGFRLLFPPAEISLLDIVEAVTGEIFLNDCIMNPESCRRSPDCSVHRVWQHAREQLRTILGKADFQTLLKGDSCLLESLPAGCLDDEQHRA